MREREPKEEMAARRSNEKEKEEVKGLKNPICK